MRVYTPVYNLKPANKKPGARRHDEWTDEELDKLKALYSDSRITIDEMMAELPGRTENAIRSKASRLRLRRPDLGGHAKLRDLRWVIHDEVGGIVYDGASFPEVLGVVKIIHGGAATGYRGRRAEVTIRPNESNF